MADVYALTADLFFGERLEQALKQLNHQGRVVTLSDGPAPVSLPEGVQLVIVDLEAGEATIEAVRQAKTAGAKVLAFGPHVDLDLRRAAREAGADQVVTKSKLTASFAELVAALV